MKLKRKLFAIQPGYYDDLNEAEKNWLEKKRSKIAKSIEKDKQKLKSEGKLDKNAKIKLRERLRREVTMAENNIRGKGKDKYLREAVNNVWQDKQLKIKKAEELAKKKAEESVEKVTKLKKIGKGALIVGGTVLGIGLSTKAIKNYKDKKKQEQTKNLVLGENNLRK